MPLKTTIASVETLQNISGEMQSTVSFKRDVCSNTKGSNYKQYNKYNR